MQRRDGLNRRPFRKYTRPENNHVPRSEGPTYWQRFRKTFWDTLPAASEYGWDNFKRSLQDDWNPEFAEQIPEYFQDPYQPGQAPYKPRIETYERRSGSRSHSRRQTSIVPVDDWNDE